MSVVQLFPQPHPPRVDQPLPQTVAELGGAAEGKGAAQSAPQAAATNPLTPSIFHERWWLEIASRGRFQAAEIQNQGRLVGWLPYVVTRRHMFRVCVMPQLTHLLGPAIDEGSGSSNTRWLRRLDVLKELIGQLPDVGLFSQTCHPDTPDVLGFQAAGFDASLQFSAETPPAPEDALWRAMRDKTRNVIRRAAERGQAQVMTDPGEFARFYADNLARADTHSYFELDLVPPLFEAGHARGQARLLAVRNRSQDVIAAVLYVWDDRRMWYLMSSRDPRFPDNGAVSLLIWEGMKDAARRGLTFDFHGVASNGSARFYAGFGAALKPRYWVHRSSASYALAHNLAVLLRGRSNRNHFIGL
jgi:hypothetical protein